VKILLATLHAKYVHASLALPSLASACAGMNGVTTVIREFTVNEPADRVLRLLVAAAALPKRQSRHLRVDPAAANNPVRPG